MNTVPFEKWPEVLEAARRGEALYYRAPLDPRPIRLIPSEGGKTRTPYTYEVKTRTIKIWPPGSVGRGTQRYSDPFTADSGHLDRFSRETRTGTQERKTAPGDKNRVRETPRNRERPISMSYGQLPPFEKFEKDIRRPNPDNSDGSAYWPEGTDYPMELVSAHEIELAEAFGLEEFRAERQITGRNTRVRGFRDNERAIYQFLEFLADRFNNGDEEAGDLASSIMMTLGYEWI